MVLLSNTKQLEGPLFFSIRQAFSEIVPVMPGDTPPAAGTVEIRPR
jgi:hypothetical protein